MQRSTWLACGVFALLAAAAVMTLTRKPERGIQRLQFTGIDPNGVDRIEVTGPMPVALHRDGAVWRVEGGREADADAVGDLLVTTARVSSSDVVTEDPNRFSDLEVDEAKGASVRLVARGKPLAAFVVGKGLTGGTAVRVGDTVFKAGGGVHAGLYVRAASDWLERRLLRDRLEDIARLHVRLKGQPPYTLVHKGSTWELLDDPATPAGFRFDPLMAQTLASAVLGARAAQILDHDPGADVTHLDADADTVTVFYTDAVAQAQKTPSRAIALGADLPDGGSVYAHVEGTGDVVTLPTHMAAGLRKPLDTLRDLTLMAFDPAKVTAVSLSDGKATVELTKGAEGWGLAKGQKAPAGFDLDPGKIAQRVSAVSHARGLRVASVAPSTAGIAPRQGRVTLTLEGRPPISLTFGAKAAEVPDGVYAQGNADAAVYVMARGLRDTLVGGLPTLKRDAGGDPLLGLDPKALQGLPADVRASLEQQIAQKRQQQATMLRVQGKR
ncbi:MAG TPA: DUF4340 domain-containing protein [Myxococcota bacterium]|nr:DUF4340 domain-containing protein [Myxococcota bacterium]